jgi:hypothetical protein
MYAGVVILCFPFQKLLGISKKNAIFMGFKIDWRF